MGDTFKHFLVEQSGRSQQIDQEQAVQFIEQYCQQYWKSDQKIYRGLQSKNSDFLMGDSSQSTRISGFATANYYNQILSNLESWQDFPRRDQSFICSTSKSIAKSYGQTYVVAIPDDTTIGIVPKIDIQIVDFYQGVSPLLVHSAIDEFDAILERDGYRFETSPDRAQQDWQALIDVLQEMSSLIEKYRLRLRKEVVPFFQYLNQHGVVNGLNQMFNPEKAGFTTNKARNVDAFPTNNEVWFSGSAVFVSTDVFQETQEMVNK